MPHTLRAINGEDDTIAELEMIVGFDDLVGGATRVANRLPHRPPARQPAWSPRRAAGRIVVARDQGPVLRVVS